MTFANAQVPVYPSAGTLLFASLITMLNAAALVVAPVNAPSRSTAR
jgi:hypothetical protein